MKTLIIIGIVILIASWTLFVLSTGEDTGSQEILIAIEQEWLEDKAGHAGKADEVGHGRKCWRADSADFHGQQTWQAWRCVVLEGPATGTIQWEWRNPKGGG